VLTDTQKRIQDWVTQRWVTLFYPGSGVDDLNVIRSLVNVVDEFHFVDTDETDRGVFQRFGSKKYLGNLFEIGFSEVTSPGVKACDEVIPETKSTIRTKKITGHYRGRIIHIRHFDCDYIEYMDWMNAKLGRVNILVLRGWQAGEGGSCFVDVFTDKVVRKGEHLPGYRDRLARICQDDVVIIDHDVLHMVRATHIQEGWRFATWE